MSTQTTISLASLVLAGSLVACANAPAAEKPIETPSCTAGETRCLGFNYETCGPTGWEVAEACDTRQVCLEGQGCAACDPGLGNTCSDTQTVVSCNADGSLGAKVKTCDISEHCQGGACESSCSNPGADLIYLVTNENKLVSFNPRKLPNAFAEVGTLDCNVALPAIGSQQPDPFSMSVDRAGNAWVLYGTGEMFNASIRDASCRAAPYQAKQGGFQLFGMGFVSNTAGSDDETLFLSGGETTTRALGRLGKIDTVGAPRTTTLIGPVIADADRMSELTGTADGHLFAFYPDTRGAFIQEVDRGTGKGIGSRLMVSSEPGDRRGWAFAHWGGKFYVFMLIGPAQAPVQYLYEVDRYTGVSKRLDVNVPYQVVGAGVSTCAPVRIE